MGLGSNVRNYGDEFVNKSRLAAPLAMFLVLFCACDANKPIQMTENGESDQRPNIIFLLADDQRGGTTSAENHPHIATPSLDALSQNGVVFSNAFSVQPICAPSRFAIFSGQYERTNGLGFNSPYRVTEAQWENTYPALLRKAGYYTGFIGKFGVEFYTFRGRTQEKFDYWRGHDGWLSFFPADNPESTAITAYADAKHVISTEIMGEYIEDFLDNLPQDKPFSLSVSFSAPHGSVSSSMYLDADTSDCTTVQCEKMGTPANKNPRIAGHPIYGDLYRDREIGVPDDLDKSPYHYLPREVIGHQKRKQWYSYLYDKKTNPEHSVRYFQLITGIDKVVGQLLKKLQDKDLQSNTIIIYSSDHGLLTGEYGVGGKSLLYDLSARVPLIVAGPGSLEHISTDALVTNVDIAPTILSYAGVDVPATMQGKDLRDVIANPQAEWRSEIFIESLTTVEDKAMSEALRTKEWKYIRYFADKKCPYTESDLDFAGQTPAFEQLFDLKQDPGERTNLVNHSEAADVLAEMRQRTSRQSIQLTEQSRTYKNSIELAARPAGEGCW